jgi:hypothetical protein
VVEIFSIFFSNVLLVFSLCFSLFAFSSEDKLESSFLKVEANSPVDNKSLK